MAAFMHRLAENQVVDADKVDGQDASSFLGKEEKAADSDLLDGLTSSDFVFALIPVAYGPGLEDFELAGGSPTECAVTNSGGVPFGSYAIGHYLYDTPAGIEPELVNMQIDETESGLASDEYEVCFATLDGTNLIGGTYATYFRFDVALASTAGTADAGGFSLEGTNKRPLGKTR
jgi:hypothetical protein